MNKGWDLKPEGLRSHSNSTPYKTEDAEEGVQSSSPYNYHHDIKCCDYFLK